MSDPVTDAVGARRAPTMFDVAERAGVSHQTVSRVVNGMPKVRQSTRERVERAIAELRFVPSSAARTLASRRSRTLGLVVAGRPDYGPSNAALGFNEAARGAGYSVVQAGIRESSAAALERAIGLLMHDSVEAIVLISDERSAVEAVRGLEPGPPLVALASEPVGGVHRVALDQYAGARIAVEHLVDLGHRDIRHLAGPVDSMDAAERERAWREVLGEHGLPVSPPLRGDWQAESGSRLGARLVADGPPDAVFAGNDQMALGLLHALRGAGLRVPEEVSVVGFDDIPEAAYLGPPLTTVRQDFSGLGGDIMAAVLTSLGDRGESVDAGDARVPELVVRASTASRRARASRG